MDVHLTQSYERMNVADALNPRTFEDGECVIRQGDVADGMYFVEAGTVRFTVVGENDVEVEVSRVTKGGYFGELALVTHRPRAASAYSVGPVRLACKYTTHPVFSSRHEHSGRINNSLSILNIYTSINLHIRDRNFLLR